MTIIELQDILKNNGIAGVGGAGFPTYVKLNEKANTIILNCAECEPLLKLHQQLMKLHARQILEMLTLIAEVVCAKEIIIGVKAAYKETVEAINAELSAFPKVRIHLLKEVYPAGDEVILIYEATGKIVAPGQLPIDNEIVVFNVETIYNAYKALHFQEPVIYKYVTVAGAVEKPVTLKVPIGITVNELVAKAGGAVIANPSYVMGGPMTGKTVTGTSVITKTSNAIIVLPEEHYVIQKKNSNTSIDLKRAMSTCCQCEMCTDLCPRNLLGHPIEPHTFMRSATSGITRDVSPFLNTFYCSACGLCEMFSCIQGLAPASLIGQCKSGLQRNGVRPEKYTKEPKANKQRQYRGVPMERLIARLDLTRFENRAVLEEELVTTKDVKIMLSQHIGAPAVPCVQKGDRITAGQMIGEAKKDSLSLPVHTSIEGVVTQVTDQYIRIEAIHEKEAI